MPTPELYSPCPVCKGAKEIDVPADPAKKRAGYVTACKMCKDGYQKIGLTEGQLEAIVTERDSLLELLDRIVKNGFADAVNELEYERVLALEKEAQEFMKGKETRAAEVRIRRGPKRISPQEPPRSSTSE